MFCLFNDNRWRYYCCTPLFYCKHIDAQHLGHISDIPDGIRFAFAAFLIYLVTSTTQIMNVFNWWVSNCTYRYTGIQVYTYRYWNHFVLHFRNLTMMTHKDTLYLQSLNLMTFQDTLCISISKYKHTPSHIMAFNL